MTMSSLPGLKGRFQGNSDLQLQRLDGIPNRQSLSKRALRVQAIAEPPVRSKPSSNGTAAPEKGVQADVLHHLAYNVGADLSKLSDLSARLAYQGVALSVRERLIDSFNATQKYWSEKDPKFIYYLSAEFLMGRSLLNTVQNLGLEGEYADTVKQLGYSMEELGDAEQNAALGNGGLGRLAACFIDSMATLDLPGWGYGIRYKYGMFKQALKDGYQLELPDIWLQNGNPWEVPRPEITYKINFYGSVKDGKWAPGEVVLAKAYDNPIPGFQTNTVGNLRLWEALPVDEFDLEAFNKGDYTGAVAARRKAEDITAVLYPNDATEEGKALRLKQQYFFVSASIQDVMARFKAKHGSKWEMLPEKACFQMNDTHPTIAVAELMRLLLDEEGLDWDHAWAITKKSLAFTNHTVMPEALEKWPVAVLGKLLPRNMEIISRINDDWRAVLKEKVEADVAARPKPTPKPAAVKTDPKPATGEEVEEEEEEDPVEAEMTRYSIITENPWAPGVKLVNMAYLACLGSKAINGVAAIHSEIIKDTILKEFYEVMPEKFQNKTNGVTPRRWLAWCNQPLAALLTRTLGSDAWINETTLLTGIASKAEDPAFQKEWQAIKLAAKEKLAAKVKVATGITIPTSSLFDVQIKRIHEYKRQYLNMLSAIYRYHQIKTATPEERKKMVPRVIMIGGKAASAYYMAKKIVRLVTALGAVVNSDPDVGDLLKVVFIPDYNVNWAEVIVPAAELNQQISTAGTEASGTSNMKFCMNGGLIIGTMDGANIEIAQEVGKENLFIFGMDADEVPAWRDSKRHEWKDYDPRFVTAINMIKDGTFGDKEYFQDLAASVSDMSKANDWFLVAPDFTDYLRAQDEVDALYKDQAAWTRRSILYTAKSGFFSSDRTIKQYAEEIWDIKPVPAPAAH